MILEKGKKDEKMGRQGQGPDHRPLPSIVVVSKRDAGGLNSGTARNRYSVNGGPRPW